MTTLAFGAYLRLLCRAWHETPVGTLPADDSSLAALARMKLKQWTSPDPEDPESEVIKRQVMAAWELKGERYHQKRMKREYKKLVDSSKSKSEAGKQGSSKRWHKHSSAIALPKLSHVLPMAENGSSSSSSISSSSSLSLSERGKEMNGELKPKRQALEILREQSQKRG